MIEFVQVIIMYQMIQAANGDILYSHGTLISRFPCNKPSTRVIDCVREEQDDVVDFVEMYDEDVIYLMQNGKVMLCSNDTVLSGDDTVDHIVSISGDRVIFVHRNGDMKLLLYRSLELSTLNTETDRSYMFSQITLTDGRTLIQYNGRKVTIDGDSLPFNVRGTVLTQMYNGTIAMGDMWSELLLVSLTTDDSEWICEKGIMYTFIRLFDGRLAGISVEDDHCVLKIHISDMQWNTHVIHCIDKLHQYYYVEGQMMQLSDGRILVNWCDITVISLEGIIEYVTPIEAQKVIQLNNGNVCLKTYNSISIITVPHLPYKYNRSIDKLSDVSIKYI